MKKKYLFIDRDGTLIIEPEDEQIDSLEKLKFYPGVISNLSRIIAELDYELILVTNQDGLGTSSFPEETFYPAQNKMLETLAGENIRFAEILIDRSTAADPGPGRKPGTAMLKKYLDLPGGLRDSFVIGDRESDVQLAANLGCSAIFLGTENSDGAVLSTKSWKDIYDYLKSLPRRATVMRKTSETDIELTFSPDGSGRANIRSGIGFFDHMLEQIARHSGCDLTLHCKGDLHVDEHHSVEDTALALGEAVDRALGSRKGIGRYGFTLPMDESLARTALDFSGRPQLVWQAEFKREKVGEMPTELFPHFFKSFCDTARCTLNIFAEGENEHHKIEAIFKSFARSLSMAVKRNSGQNDVPSTKGSL